MALKTFYLGRFGYIPIISYKNTSVEQNENKRYTQILYSKN